MENKSGHFRFSSLISILIILLFTFCIEPYNFKIENTGPGIVVEGYISDISFNESKNYPSDGRYFEVKLSETSEVTNIVNKPVMGASIFLTDDFDNAWYYNEDYSRPGIYRLFDEDFKAEKGIGYKLILILPNGETYESAVEQLPQNKPDPIGQVAFSETKRLVFIYKSGEKTIDEIDAIDISIDVPKNSTSEKLYCKWIVTPTWVYKAPFTRASEPIHTCWINEPFYLNDYQMNEVANGDYQQYLTYIQTTANERIFKQFSLLVTQVNMSPDYYNYWKELKAQSKRGQIFDPPPFNLKTNFKQPDGEELVSGYFGVVYEQATRWYFNKDQLSYPVIDNTLDLCNIVYGPGAKGGPACYNCLDYTPGVSTNIKPPWWID